MGEQLFVGNKIRRLQANNLIRYYCCIPGGCKSASDDSDKEKTGIRLV